MKLNGTITTKIQKARIYLEDLGQNGTKILVTGKHRGENPIDQLIIYALPEKLLTLDPEMEGLIKRKMAPVIGKKNDRIVDVIEALEDVIDTLEFRNPSDNPELMDILREKVMELDDLIDLEGEFYPAFEKKSKSYKIQAVAAAAGAIGLVVGCLCAFGLL